MTTALFALASGGALLLGAALGAIREPPRALNASMLAFGAGALVVAVAFELFEPAHSQAGLARASLALVVGAAVFIGIDLLLERYTGREATGLALVVAVTLDGVPENLALGVGLADGGSIALLAAIVASNFAEAFGGAAVTRASGRSAAYALGVWALTGVLLVVALLVGTLAAGALAPTETGMLAAFAAGAVLASIAVTVHPEAYREGGPLVAFATTAGFLVAYALTTLD